MPIVLLLLFLLAGIAAPQPAVAQTPPDAATCEAAAAGLAARTARETWGLLPLCGTVGATALANAVAGSRATDDAEYLAQLAGLAGGVRDPLVFDAAALVSSDRAATAPARLAALLVLLRQFDDGTGVSVRVSTVELLRNAAAPAVACPLAALTGANYAVVRPLAAASDARLAAILDALRHDGAGPGALRATAQCARDRLRAALPAPTVPASAIRLTYLCDTRFRVRNSGREWIEVSFDVYRTPETGNLTVAPSGETIFSTDRRGTVRLFYLGRLVQTKANGGTRCPR